jgi:hypothetical protein
MPKNRIFGAKEEPEKGMKEFSYGLVLCRKFSLARPLVLCTHLDGYTPPVAINSKQK